MNDQNQEEPRVVEAEPIFGIRATINEALAKYDETGAAVAELREQLWNLEIEGPEDKRGRKAVDDGRKLAKRRRTAVNRRRLELNEDAKRYTQAVNGRANELMEPLKAIEDHLQEKLNAHADAVKAAEEQRTAARLEALSAVDCHMTSASVKALDEAGFEALLATATERWEAAKEAERERLAEIERKEHEAEEEAKKARKAQEEADKAREDLEERERALAEREAALEEKAKALQPAPPEEAEVGSVAPVIPVEVTAEDVGGKPVELEVGDDYPAGTAADLEEVEYEEEEDPDAIAVDEDDEAKPLEPTDAELVEIYASEVVAVDLPAGAGYDPVERAREYFLAALNDIIEGLRKEE